jgi:hypothetical protein
LGFFETFYIFIKIIIYTYNGLGINSGPKW